MLFDSVVQDFGKAVVRIKVKRGTNTLKEEVFLKGDKQGRKYCFMLLLAVD